MSVQRQGVGVTRKCGAGVQKGETDETGKVDGSQPEGSRVPVS